jgi:hypothetical protein
VKSRRSGFFGFGKRYDRNVEGNSKRPILRRGLIESLERREMLSADWNPAILANTGFFASAQARTAAIQMVQARASGMSGGMTSPSSEPEGSSNSGLFTMSEVEPNNTRLSAQHIPLGLGSNQFASVNVSGTSPAGDTDWYSFDLKGGDILDIRLTSLANTPPQMSIVDPTGRTLITSAGAPPSLFGFPNNSPLTGSPSAPSGLAAIHYIIPQDGRYYFRLSEVGFSYVSAFRVYRPFLESQPAGTNQILFLDFEGAIIPRSTFGLGPGNFVLEGATEFLPDMGLQFSDRDRFIDEVVARVTDKFQRVSLVANNSNYGIQIKNSRDHGDMWGQPNVSRVVIGGSLVEDELLEAFLGIAEAVDVGNFNTQMTGFVQIPLTAESLIEPVIVSGNATRLQAAAEVIAVITSHEAGHFFGLWHQDITSSVFGLMNTGGSPPEIVVGAGLDGIFGTADDQPLQFTLDRFTNEGLFLRGGVNDSINWLGWALTTGRQGGSVEGVIYQDVNLNRSLDNKDIRLSQVLVYADLNGNGVHDAGEPSTFSGTDGGYSLLLAPGSYTIRSQVPPGFRPVAPLSNSYNVNVSLGGKLTGRNFGHEQVATNVTGRVWNDLNANGLRDSSEPGLADRWVYIDLDNDCRMDIGEPAVRTKADGTYTLPSPGAGTFFIRQLIEPGQVQTHPVQNPNAPDVDGCSPIGHRVTLTGNPVTDQPILAGLDFGNQFLINNSDAPPSFGTASHGFVNGLHLGPLWNVKDGVNLVQPLVRGSAENRIQVRATNTTGQPAYLNAWMDFNGNGSFGTGEKIFDGLLLPQGVHLLTFTIPANAQLGDAVARFRYSFDRNLGPTGFSSSGEVEDYVFRIVDTFSLAVDDTASVSFNSALNSIDVLANDFRAGPDDLLRVVATSGLTSSGGQVVISASQDRVLYTPPVGFIGTDTFTYTMQNSFGQQGTATVAVTVNFFFDEPRAVDDSFEVPTNSVAFPLNVLANDIEGRDGALSIISVTQPNRGGQITIATGGKSLRYTPAANFGGTEFFTYTAIDAAGNRTSAKVTLHTLPGARLDDEVEIRLVATDLNGNPISAIEQGRDFKVSVFVDDLRFSAANPGISAGVFAAYFDLLYSAQLVSLKPTSTPGSRFNFDVQFLNGYVNFTTGDASVPGIIDEFGATSNSFNMQNPEPLKLAEITFTARSAGIANFMPDPADLVDQSDTLLFNVPGSPVPVERIRFLGTQLQIFGDGVQFPIAVDDSVPGSIPVNSIRFPIDVLANDLRGSTGSVSIVNFTNGSRGSVFQENRGGNPADPILTYTPNTNFVGFDQFTYTIQDSRGIRSTATVSLRVGDPTPEDMIADFDLVVTDLSGQPIDQITVGSQFQLRAFVQDARPAGANRGLFTAYMDVLYSSSLVSPVLSNTNDPNLGFVVSFGPTYSQVREGDVRIPGLINEIGAQSSSPTPVGSNRFLLFTVTMTANSVGLANFISDPADISPFHDTLTYVPAQPVPPENIRFGFDQLRIVAGSGGGSGEFHNSTRPLDVNNDGHISAIDALLIINHLNGIGPGTAGGEGELVGNFFPDTNGDGRISAIDALLVVNHLNDRNTGGGGEGESSDGWTHLIAPVVQDRSANSPQVSSRHVSQESELVSELVSARLIGDLPAVESRGGKFEPTSASVTDYLMSQHQKEQSRWRMAADKLVAELEQELDLNF